MISVIICCYLSRRTLVDFLDSLSVLSWLSANFIWMCGEFFLRYRNMEEDDVTQGNVYAIITITSALSV